MAVATIPPRAIFVEREGWVFYVTNWQRRYTESSAPTLVRLSPRHFVRYHELKAKGRSPKTIAMLLFKRPPARSPATPGAVRAPVERGVDPDFERTDASRVVSVDIDLLNAEQVLALLQRTLHRKFPGLRTLPIGELRKLYLAIEALRRAG
jgi:hypothetical protein